MEKTKDLTKVKARLIELGYIDNEWLDKYLEVIEANLETKEDRTATQAHHAIPVNAYWTSTEPYKRNEALKLARADKINFEVHLLYKDHLLIHSYLTLCTNLEAVQQRYESQADLRKRNSKIGTEAQKLNRTKISNRCHIHKDGIYKNIVRKNLNKYLREGWKLGASGKPRYKTEKTQN